MEAVVRTRMTKAAVLARAMIGVSIAAGAQSGNTRVYREGNAWVEETTGALPQGRNLRVDVSMGTVNVQGGASSANYTIRKKSYMSSEDAARREFENFHVSTASQGDTIVVRSDFSHGQSHRMSAEFNLNVP